MLFILSDILPTHCPFPICHGIWHCRGMVILSTDFHRFMECGGGFRIVVWYCPIVVLSHCGVLSAYCQVYPPTDIILPLWGKTKWVMCEFFHPLPIVSWHCRDTKTLPTDFHWSMGRGRISHIMYCGVWGMSDCRHCVLFVCLHYYYTRWWGKIQ